MTYRRWADLREDVQSSNVIRAHDKAPLEVTEIAVDWYDQVHRDMDRTDVLMGAAWSVPAPLTLVSERVDHNTAIARVSGGSAATEYQLTCTATFASGRVVPRVVMMTVRAI